MARNIGNISDAQLRSLAKRYLSGYMPSDLVGFANLDIDQIRRILRTKSMKRVLAEEQEHLDRAAVRIRNNMSYGIEDSVNRMKSRGAGCDGPQIAFAADKFMIDALLPKKEHHIVEENVHHTFDANIALKINDALDTVKTVLQQSGAEGSGGNGRSSLSSYTLLGTEGLSRIEPENPQELVVVDGSTNQPNQPQTPNPSNPTSEESESGGPDSTPPE